MRIIAGKLKGTTLHLPQNKIIRPLKDRARESIFNLLTHSSKILLQLEQSKVYFNCWNQKVHTIWERIY